MQRKWTAIAIMIVLICSITKLALADENKKIITSVHLTAGYTAANNNSSDFFEVYQDELNGLKKDFIFPALAGLSVKVKYPENIRFGLDCHYQFIDMKDNYEEKVNLGYTGGTRKIAQDFEITTRVFYAIIEYIPIISQFRTYAGAGIGANFGSIIWKEFVKSDIPYDKRFGGKHFDKLSVDPAIKLYTGLELGFDKENEDDYLGSVFFELAFYKIFRYENIFADVYQQLEKPSEKILQSYGLANFYLSFNIGVSFNVDIFKLNIDKNKKQ